MDSPRSGFRRAAATSWVLAGIGIAGVGGASALAYGDTARPVSADAPTDAAELAPGDLGSNPASNVPPVPDVVTTTVDPPQPSVTTAPPAPEVTPEKTVEQAPVATHTPLPQYTPEATVEQAPAPVTHETTVPVTAPPTTHRQLTPTTVMAPNYSPPVTRSRGS
jgi:protein TonB